MGEVKDDHDFPRIEHTRDAGLESSGRREKELVNTVLKRMGFVPEEYEGWYQV